MHYDLALWDGNALVLYIFCICVFFACELFACGRLNICMAIFVEHFRQCVSHW